MNSVFHQSEIVVGVDGNGITGWSLKALPAEQRYHADQSGTVGSRIATAVPSAANLRLPAIDTAFAIPYGGDIAVDFTVDQPNDRCSASGFSDRDARIAPSPG
jgi:hypothetical protein